MYLMILFGLSTTQLNSFITFLLLNQKYLQMQRTRLATIMKKREIRKKLLLAKTRTAQRSYCWVKKGRANAWWENLIANKAPESEWKDKFLNVAKKFSRVTLFVETISRKETYLSVISVEAQVDSFLYYISDEGRYRKTANAFGMSRASISGIIRRVIYNVTRFLGPKLIKLLTTEGEIQELTDRYLARSTRFSTVHRCDWWNSYRNSRTKWILFRFYQQKGLFFIKCSGGVWLQVLFPRCSSKMAW